MSRRASARLALAAIALAACVVNLSFDMDQPGLDILAPQAGSLSQNVLVDLGSNNDVRAHQNDIKSLDLEYVDVTITDVRLANAATTLSLTVSLRKNVTDPPATDVTVKVGDLQSFPVMQSATRRVAGNPEIDAFLLDRLHDGGKFYVVLSGTTDGKTDVVVDVNLHASMGYETGLF
jgi:type IV secretory pathway ATPase VirB11/archaellum biosynthesis ATPase